MASKAERIDGQIQQLSRDHALSQISLGRLLRIMRDEELWYDLRFRDFDDYCDRTLGFGEAGATVRIHVADVFGDLKIGETEILPITKMKIISGVVFTSADAKRWMKRGRKLTCDQLRDEIRKERRRLVRAGKLPTNKIGTDRIHAMGITFTEREKRTVKKAIGEMVERGDATTHGEVVAQLAERYLGSLRKLKVA